MSTTPEPANGNTPDVEADETTQQPVPSATPPPPAADATPPAPEDSDTTDQLNVPDSLGGVLRFDKPDYPTAISGSGAGKLVDSQVSPLVAAARGYESVTAADLPELTKRASDIETPDRTKRLRGEQVREALQSDALVMPWYAADAVLAAGEQMPGESLLQLRPAEPIHTGRTDDSGKPIVKKYDNLAGADTVVDVHPATPPEWFSDTTIPIIFTEGIIKADSALTALLLEAGYTSGDLIAPEESDFGATRSMARTQMRAMMRDLTESRRFIMLAAVGVGNWQGASSRWTSVKLKSRRFHVAFDGDMARNRNVWNQTNKLWNYATRRSANVSLIDLASDSETMTGQLGLDDFFGVGGEHTFDSVISRLASALPPRPGNDDEFAGAWRITADGCTTEECVESKGDNGEMNLHWERRLNYGARVKSMYSLTNPQATDTELGHYDKHMAVQHDQTRVEIEFSWRSKLTGEVETAIVTGLGNLLEQTPVNWSRFGKATIPQNLAIHPEWPPRQKTAEMFCSTFKANRADEIEHAFAWDAMGWLPGRDAPVFIVGDEVYSVDDSEDSIRPGVSDLQVSSAGRYGLPDPGFDMDDPSAEDSVADLLREVSGLFLGKVPGLPVERQPFRRTDYGAVLFLAGIRPLIPYSPRFSLYLYGPPQKGKSYAAGCVLAFWQKEAGAFGEGKLPGSAADTFASTEYTLSRVPIWLMDDVSPKQSTRAAEQQATAVEDLLRAMFNNASKNRMQIKDGDMMARPTSPPRALFMVTGEMEPATPSIRQRILLMSMDGSVFGEGKEVLDPMREMREQTNAAARLNRLMLDAVLDDIRSHPEGWKGYRHDVIDRVASLRTGFSDQMDVADATRPAQKAADLSLSIMALEALSAKWFSKNSNRKMVNDLIADLLQHVSTVALESYLDQKFDTEGVRLMEGVVSLLRTGVAHIVNPVAPARPPLNAPNSEMSNLQLGWSGTDPKPQSTMIGSLYTRDRDEGDALVLLDTSEAFRLVAARRPDLIPRATSPSTAWHSVWNSSIPVEDEWSRPKSKSGARKHFVQVTMPQGNRASVIPVSLKKILGSEPMVDHGVLEAMASRTAEAEDFGEENFLL